MEKLSPEGLKNISGLFPFVAVYRLWIVSARLLVSGKT